MNNYWENMTMQVLASIVEGHSQRVDSQCSRGNLYHIVTHIDQKEHG